MNRGIGRVRTEIIFLVVLVLIMSAAVFFPFDFFPPNRVSWLSPDSGIYFQGEGIGYTDPFIGDDRLDPLDGVTIELWLRERAGSQNSGAREIFSFFDGSPSPSLLIGEYGRKIFSFSRFEKADVEEWWSQFRPDHKFARGPVHFVAVTYQESQKALFIDGVLANRQHTDPRGGEPVRFWGRLVLGNSPAGGDGWWGEVHGLVIHDRALTADEILQHAQRVRRGGVRSLVDEMTVLALYPFDEGEGGTAENLVSGVGPIQFPRRVSALAGSMLRHPGDDNRRGFVDPRDMLQNILFFVPFGFLVGMLAVKRDETVRCLRLCAPAVFAGCLLSSTFEIVQIYLPSRSASTMDIAWNTAGALLGALLLLAARMRMPQKPSQNARA